VKVILISIFTVALGLILVIEVGLRSRYGFGNPLVYIRDEKIGYLLAPNQSTRRNGNRIEINEYSMRSAPISKTPAPETVRILLLGDSIANGGWWTDQSKTISSLMMQSLTIDDRKVEVLNVSANSWGPRNEFEYLQKFGSFDAQVVILLINTDDLFATAPTSLPIGRDRNYPDKKPPLALVEVFQRYIQKPKLIPELAAIHKEGGDRVGINLEAIDKIHTIVNQGHSKFLLAMTPLKRELGNSSRDYEITARQRLTEFAKVHSISYVDFLPLFNAHQNPESLYHDHIHLNMSGNQFVSGIIEQSLLELVRQKQTSTITQS
jgi:hypothetical protein